MKRWTNIYFFGLWMTNLGGRVDINLHGRSAVLIDRGRLPRYGREIVSTISSVVTMALA